MRLFDTHAHLQDERFDDDREDMIARFEQDGIELVMDIACNVGESRRIVEFAQRHERIYAAVGVHPHDAAGMTCGDLDILERLSADKKVVAIGEIGLDYHYDHSPRDVQQRRFIEQLQLARALGLPVIIHSREASADTLRILREQHVCSGVMHCFSGSWETAKQCLDLGMYISFAGPVTFPSAHKAIPIIERMPTDRILIETDCPYLAPVPKRGTRNEPAYVRFTAERIAEIRSEDVETFAQSAFDNGRRLFGIIS